MRIKLLEGQVLELKKGEYKIIRIGNVRFECLAECDSDASKEIWAGFIEGEKEDTPIFCNKHEGFTIERIQKCCDATAEFLKFLEREKEREVGRKGKLKKPRLHRAVSYR